MGLVRKKATEVVGGANEEGSEKSLYNWENLEEGEHECRLAYVADLGLQRKEFKGEFTGNFQQIALGLDVVDHAGTDEEGNTIPRILWTKPFYIYDKMTEKGKELEYYKLFDSSATQYTKAEWDAQLGKPLNAVVVHVQGKGENSDKTYDNVQGVSAIPLKYQGSVSPAVATDVGIGDSDDPDNTVTKGLFGLPKFIYDRRIGAAKQEVEPKVAPKATTKVTSEVPAVAEESPY